MNAGTPVRFKRDEYERGWAWGVGHVVSVYLDDTPSLAIYYPDGRIAIGEEWMLNDLSDSDEAEFCDVNLELSFADGRRVHLTREMMRRGVDKTEKEELALDGFLATMTHAEAALVDEAAEIDRDAEKDPAS